MLVLMVFGKKLLDKIIHPEKYVEGISNVQMLEEDSDHWLNGSHLDYSLDRHLQPRAVVFKEKEHLEASPNRCSHISKFESLKFSISHTQINF